MKPPRATPASGVVVAPGQFAVPAAGMAAWFGGVGLAAEAHEVMFNLLFALVLAHVGAALIHQFVFKDHLIARMMKAD